MRRASDSSRKGDRQLALTRNSADPEGHRIVCTLLVREFQAAEELTTLVRVST
jgi:hypothetical protein